MVPHNFNPGLMQQHQQHSQAQQLGSQQGQQQQEGHSQLDVRAWQQQQQMHAMEQLRQAGGNPANQQQMLELMRQRSMQQQQQQQRQQQFGNGQQLGIPGQQGLGMGGQAGGPQQPSMGQGAPGPQHPQHMQGGFSGAPGLSNQQSMTMNRTAMIQALQNGGPQFSRQLDLMLQQQGQQQPQGSPMQMQARLEQQQRQQMQMGTNPAGQQVAQQLQPGGQPPRRLTPQELTQRASALRVSINNMEETYQKMVQGMPPGPEKEARLQGLVRDISVRKEAFTKMQQALTQMAQNGGQLPPAGPGPSPWNIGGFENPGNNQPPRPMSTQATGPSPNVQPSPSHVHSTPLQQPNLLPNQPGIVPPPRSGPTPSQQTPHPPNGTPGGPGPSNNAVAGTPNPFGTQMSPSMGQLFPFNNSAPNATNPSTSAPGVQQMPSGGPPGVAAAWPPALDKQKFDAAYKTYSARTGIKHEMRLMNMDGKPIDLYALHVNVMQEGGWTKVHNKELWSVIGGRMGFVNFPGSDTEPAKSGPGVAQRLAQVYKEYLSGFDQVYINSVIDSRRKMQANQAGNGATMPNIPINNAMQGQPAAQGVPGAPGPLGGGAVAGAAGLKHPFNNPIQLAKLMHFASLPPDQLRNQGLPEHMIQFIEQNRANIQRASQQGQMQQAAALRAQVPEQTPGGQPQPQLGSPFGGVAGLPPSNQPGQGQSFPGQPPNGMPGMHPGGLPDNQPHMPPQQVMFGQAPGISGPPNPEQIQIAQNFIARVQLEFRQRNLPTFRPFELPSEGRVEYQSMFQQLVVQVDKLSHRMPYLYFALRSEDSMRKVIAMIMTAKYQQQLLQSGNPRVVITPELLRTMLAQVQAADNALTRFFVDKARPQVPGQMPPGMQDMNRQQPPMVQPPPQPIAQQQPPIQPPNQPQSIPPNTLPTNRIAMNLRAPPKKPPGPTSAGNQPLSAATPPYSATTPVASASTPTATATASSPQQNQSISSPKTRAKAKPTPPNSAKQPVPRRPSVKGQGAPAATAEPAPAAPAAKVDASGSNAATPNTGKRPREEEPVPGPSTSTENADASSSAVANEPSPPKRMKTDWDVPPNEESKKNQETAENVKNEEDASAFLEQMTELIRQSGQESTLSSDISETLDMLLKGCGNTTDGLDLSSLNAFGDSSTLGSTGKPSMEDFGDFFDWASFNNTQADESKAPTPELSTSSSTNPSPESGSESEAAHHSTSLISDAKTDEIPELLKLGTWKEIDGGESAYFQAPEWKWDGLMSTQDQPWAIS